MDDKSHYAHQLWDKMGWMSSKFRLFLLAKDLAERKRKMAQDHEYRESGAKQKAKGTISN